MKLLCAMVMLPLVGYDIWRHRIVSVNAGQPHNDPPNKINYVSCCVFLNIRFSKIEILWQIL